MDNNITVLLMQVATGLIGIVTTVVGAYVASFLKKRGLLDEQTMQGRIVKDAIKYVEQTGQEMTGSEKFAEARKEIVKALNEKKIPFTESDIDRLIESAVFNLKNGANSQAQIFVQEDLKLDNNSEPVFTPSENGIMIDGELYVKAETQSK